MKINLLGKLNWKKITKIDELGFEGIGNKYKLIAKELKYVFFFKPNVIKIKRTELDFLFIKSLDRSDYNELFDTIYSTCESKKKKRVDVKYVNAGLIRAYPLFVFVKNILVYRHALRPSFLLTILLIIKITKYLEIYERTKKYQSKVLVVFADMQAVDNMLVQIANKKGIKTVTMQHGLYVDYKGYPTENAVNYLHAAADTFLAWGEDTVELIRRHHPHIKTELVGKPSYLKSAVEKEAYFTIVFDSNYFFEHNIELLKIAYELCDKFNLKVNVQFHPYNRKELVTIDEEKTLVSANIMASKFILGHTTTMLYDCMIAGIPSFRYKTDKPSINTLSELEFSNVNECVEILNNQEVMTLDFNDLGRHYFKYMSEESRNKYGEFFRALDKQLNS